MLELLFLYVCHPARTEAVQPLVCITTLFDRDNQSRFMTVIEYRLTAEGNEMLSRFNNHLCSLL